VHIKTEKWLLNHRQTTSIKLQW